MQLRIFSRTGGQLKTRLPHVTTNFQSFLDWIPLNEYVAHDLETTYTNRLFERKMITATYFYSDTAWVIFIEELTPKELASLVVVMQQGKFIIQSVKFEFKEWKKYGIELNRFYDTMLAEKLLNMGNDFAGNDLATILNKYVGILLDKELQTSFTSASDITDEQIKYAVKDVMHLHTVKELQEDAMHYHDLDLQPKFPNRKNRGLKKANWWNQEFIKVIAELEYQGVLLDVPAWKKLYEEALPLVQTAEKKLNEIVFRDFKSRAIADEFIYAEDTFHPKLFTSSSRKKELLSILFDDIENTSELELKKYLMKHDEDWPVELKPTSKYVESYLMHIDTAKPKYIPLKLLLLKRTEDVKKLFYINFKGELIKRGLLTPKDTVNINWASPLQRMTIFKWIAPKLESTDRPHMEEVAYIHELLSTYLEHYQKIIGMVTKFGLNYLEHIEDDGRLRTNINPIINTGRMSSSKPNLLNIINDARYRACFIAGKGYKYVMTDYQGEELVLTAFFANEPLWLDAIRAGHDLHSINAAAIFDREWKEGEESDCAFTLTKEKCNCKVHKKLRSNTKALEFGSLYGMSKFGMAFRLHISVEDADVMLKEFFKQLPNIDKFLKGLSQFAFKHLYSPELVLGACRFVDKKKLHYDKNSIARTSSNFGIQGAGASVLKIATVLIRRHIKQMKHDATIIIAPYDEIIMEVRDDIAEYWKIKLQYYMELAGQLALQDPILKTDAALIGDYWIH